MKMTSIKLLLLSSFLLAGSVIGQDSTLYRVKLPSRRWTAQLRGVSGERTQAEQKTGTYDYWYGTHNFWIVLSGPYQMFLDRTGGSSFAEDTLWAGLDDIGKWINGPDIIDVVSDSLLLDEFLNVRIPPSTDDGDADLILVNASGDSAWIWNENTTAWNSWGRRSLHVGHQTGGMLILGRWDGRYDDSVVLIAGEHFLLSPRADMDSVFYAHIDSANNEMNLWLKGNIYFAPGADGDADLILSDATGNQHWIWAENTPADVPLKKRGLILGHANGGVLVLGKWDGQYEESWVVFRGEHFMMTPHTDVDSLFYAHLDSANNEINIWMKGNWHLGPGADDDADIILENTAGDSMWIWAEYEQYLNRRGMYLGHHTGGMIVLGRWDGQYEESMVVFRGEHFLMYPSIVAGVDSVFYVHIDSANNRADTYLKGSMIIREDYADNRPVLTLIQDYDGVGGPHYKLYNNADFSNPNMAGSLTWYANNSVATQTDFAMIRVQSVNTTDGAEDGIVYYDAMFNGIERAYLTFRGDLGNIILNEDGQDLSTIIEAAGVATALVVDGATGKVTMQSNNILEGGATRNIIRTIDITLQPGAIPGTNIDCTENQGSSYTFNGVTVTDGTDIAKSGSSGSFALNAGGDSITLDLTEDVIAVLSVTFVSHDLNTSHVTETYWTSAAVTGANIVLVTKLSGTSTDVDWTSILDAGDVHQIQVTFITSS